ncbi:MAG: energy transducer TonB [Bacteroidia bacterium]|nr:energy transducer TonB [Bacteroidia bacterium]
MPEYKAGMPEWYQFIGKNVIYPKAARESNTEGRIFVSFVVDKSGKVSQVEMISQQVRKDGDFQEMVVVGNSEESDKILKKVMATLEAEAVRVVSQLGAFNPGIKDGKPVNTKMVLPIIFKLEKVAWEYSFSNPAWPWALSTVSTPGC